MAREDNNYKFNLIVIKCMPSNSQYKIYRKRCINGIKVEKKQPIYVKLIHYFWF